MDIFRCTIKRNCAVCAKPIKVKILRLFNRILGGGYYFGRMTMPGHRNPEYWECEECYNKTEGYDSERDKMDIKSFIIYKILYAPMNLAMKVAGKLYSLPKMTPRWKLNLHIACIKFYDVIYVMEGIKGWRLSCLSDKEGTLTMHDYC